MVERIRLSPRIIHFEWGRLDIEGMGTFRDAKIHPGGARNWDWSETGTHHNPGIQPADVQELIENGAQVIVLSKGVHEQLMVMPETLAYLQENGITTYVLQTEAAVEKYNELCAAGVAVGALIRSTC
jgi:hypothetical protein